MAEVVLRNVNKFYNKLLAVKNLNLEVKEGEFVVLVGPSGCGKSTILKMIAGLEEVTSGEIYIDGVLMNNIAPKDRNVAMVFQNYALYPHMNVYENIAFGLKLRGFSKKEIERKVREVAEILEIGELLNRKPKELSGGQQQRVAVGRAIVRNPKVFLFDEPLSNLDAKLRVQMRAELGRLHTRLKCTIIYVTHDQIEAMTLGSKIVVLKDGVVQQIDDPINLYNHPVNKFVAGFIGFPPMNFLPCKLLKKEDGFYLCNEILNLKIHGEALHSHLNKPLTLGIRPENVKIINGGMRGRVELIEPMGSYTYLYLKLGNHSIVSRVESWRAFSIGEELNLQFEPEKIYLFDQNGNTIKS